MNDGNTTVHQLREMVRQFVEDRHWQPFHAPKNLSMALAIEAAELMEHFQWMEIEESRKIPESRATLEMVGEELADVVCYALAMANSLQLDLASTMQAKMQKNIAKYPAPLPESK